MSLELDHVLVFVDPEVTEAAVLEAAGFDVRPVHPHPGQGTANRSLVFGENYLELIFLTSRVDAEANVMRLDRRADWATTGLSPFGIGLRGPVPSEVRADFWAYRPPYASPGRPPIWIHRSHGDSPGAPLVFVMEPSAALPLERMRPAAWGNQPQLCRTHGATGIGRVRIVTPDAAAWPPGVPMPRVEILPGPRHHVTVELDADPFPAVEPGDLLTVAPRTASP